MIAGQKPIKRTYCLTDKAPAKAKESFERWKKTNENKLISIYC